MENYHEKAKLKEFNPSYGEAFERGGSRSDPVDANLTLVVKGNRIGCFIHDKKSLQLFASARAGTEIYVQLRFVNYSFEKSDASVEFKDIREEKYGKNCGVNYYRANGKIVKMLPFDRNTKLAVVDCGFFILTELPEGSGLKEGDYIRLEGRLDAYITEEGRK